MDQALGDSRLDRDVDESLRITEAGARRGNGRESSSKRARLASKSTLASAKVDSALSAEGSQMGQLDFE